MTITDAICRTLDDAVVLRIRVTPKSRADTIDGFHKAADGTLALRVRVTAAPEKSKANKSVIALLAKQLGFAKSSLEIIAGQTSRNKQIKIYGTPKAIAQELRAKLQSLEDGD